MYNTMIMKFAVIHTGGKQYIAEEGKKFKIEKIVGDYRIGDKLSFDNVILSIDGDKVNMGAPYNGDKVTAELIDIERHAKIDVIKYLQKSRYYKKKGHKQPYFEIKILTI